jgi:hypothetical protein
MNTYQVFHRNGYHHLVAGGSAIDYYGIVNTATGEWVVSPDRKVDSLDLEHTAYRWNKTPQVAPDAPIDLDGLLDTYKATARK